MKNVRNNSGFTLIELMIVVVIIGILAAIAIPKFTQVSDSAKQAEAEPIMKQLCSLAEAEYLKEGSWPALADIGGWVEPDAKHFDSFDFEDGVASATAGDTGANDAEMNCETKTITVSEDA